MSILMMINLTAPMMFMFMNHPLSAGMILLSQTTITALMIGYLNQNMWYSYILFLIMVGGMMILFMYMTSIASNEKFYVNYMILFTMMIPPLLLMTINFNKTISNNQTIEMMSLMTTNTPINKYLNFPENLATYFMMIYLLMTLIATVKITMFKNGSVRQMN
uniref:NADH-ubiquinone oxidoreductase chain 6 n=1 Tax=Scaphidema metallicum TaxID=1586539 RepID=A0A343C3P1_9CUCU|nr:NADH dehydrogenase subunit 6 [Scaphidema metallicum]